MGIASLQIRPHVEMEARGPYNALLQRSKAVINRDGNGTTANQIAAQAMALSEELRKFAGFRVALTLACADHLAIALAATELAACSLAVYRGDELPDHLANRWGVAVVLNSSFTIRVVETGSARESRPYIYIPTSGTTGEPKLVQQTMDALLGRVVRRESENGERSRWLLTYHPGTFGGLQVLLTALSDAADLITVSNASMSRMREAALANQVTHISGTPTFWRALLSALGDDSSRLHLRQITLGGEIADEAVLRLLSTKFPGVPIRHIYASTEAGSLFAVRDGKAGFPAEWLRTGVDGVQLRIVDGILQVRSPRAMAGYATPTVSAISDDGWLITGDQVQQSGDRVYFRGRQDLVLNVGGAKCRPEEIEAVILGMEEVMDAHVYGVRNPITGMVVAADVVPRFGCDSDHLRQLIHARLYSVLEPYKVPRLIRIVKSITLSASGKKTNAE